MAAKTLQYDDDMLQQINDNVDLYEYASQNMELVRRGEDYFAHCPLHTDLTPSLCITPSKNKFYCFSCGKAGGIIAYLRHFEGLRFSEAVEKAARLADVDLSKMCRSETIIYLRSVRKSLANRKRVPYEHEILPETNYSKYEKQPIEEWINEGIKPEILDLFDVRLDLWSNRIVYPVRDVAGRLINIKGRTRYPDYKKLGIPKYMNYWPVGVVDYFQGLNITLPYIEKSGEIIIFESIKSVMLAYGWGYKNVVSAEKHTLTPEQVDIIVKLRVNVVFAYDSDISYRQHDVWEDIAKLKRVTNVFVVVDKDMLLGGAKSKNAPVDMGREIWEQLYEQKKKVV